MSKIVLNNLGTPPGDPGVGKSAIFVDSANGPSVRKGGPGGGVETFKSLFGTGFASKKKTADETNSSTTPEIYDSLSIIGAPAGNYLVFLRWVWGYSSGSQDIRVQWYLDNNPMIEEHRQEPKDGGSNQRMHESVPTVISLDGDHEIKVEYSSSAAGNQARMYETEIILFRID